jgi:hypothetical protein
MTDRMGSAMETGDDKTKITRLWSRLRAMPAPIARTPEARALEDCQGESIAPLRPDAARGAVVLPFPLRGEALLVKLADRLRSRFTETELERDLLLLTISRCPDSRLSIDHDAYVEFHADAAMYHVAIEAVPDTRIMLDTTDFDTVVNFVAHYLAGRLPMSASLGALL